jgi:adenylate cyclase class 2
MMEIEAKIRVEALEPLRTRLQQRKARHMGLQVERDVYFNAPDRDFGSSDEALRIRYGGSEPVLTYKGPRLPGEGPKAREEICVSVDRGDLMELLLQRLGFRPAAQVVKERDLYQLEGATIALDLVEALGTFIEIEAPPGLSREEAADRIREISEGLGVRGEPIALSYLEMVLATRPGS